MKIFTIDINVDVGEGLNNEAKLMPFISSCNIACGGHAGDVATMRRLVKLAKKYSVKIGAHPSFPDRENFGRKKINIATDALFLSIREQIMDLMAVLKEENIPLHHIKPHGALYNMAAADVSTASVLIEVIKSFSAEIKLYAPYNSVIANLAVKAKIPVVFEAFADRNYNKDLSLVSRNSENAMILDSEAVFNHVNRIISQQKVKTICGAEVKLIASTICLHSDMPNAAHLIRNLNDRLQQNNICIS